MRRDIAIALLGGTIRSAADRIGCTYQAVRHWPDPLPSRISDRVYASLWRENFGAVEVDSFDEMPPWVRRLCADAAEGVR